MVLPLLAAGFLNVGWAAESQPAPRDEAATRPAATSPASGRPAVVDFQPGIRIDWARPQVEVRATVILREGFLELLACSPRIREHESIVRIEARPTHLFMALGLIGLTPGRPAWYEPDTGRSGPATGDSVEIDVRYAAPDGLRTVPLEDWTRPVDGTDPVDRLPWVFAGSIPSPDGAIAADVEGTVVAVVDFSTALIALPEHHSDRNEELWLAPRTEAIPPLGTECVLVFRPGPVRITLDATGRLTVGGQRMPLGDLAGRLGRPLEGDRAARLHVLIDPRSPRSDQRQLLSHLERLGWVAEQMTVERRAFTEIVVHDPEALAAWLLRMRAHSPATPPDAATTTTAPGDPPHDR